MQFAALEGDSVAAPTIEGRWDADRKVATPTMIGRQSDDRVAGTPIVAVAGATIGGTIQKEAPKVATPTIL